MSEQGCNIDINSKNIQCEKLLIKNDTIDLLLTDADNNLRVNTKIYLNSEQNLTDDYQLVTKKYVDDNGGGGGGGSGITNNRIGDDLIIGEDSSNLLVINSDTRFNGGISGNVGIGTTTPQKPLHISKEAPSSGTVTEMLQLALTELTAPIQQAGSGTQINFTNQKNLSDGNGTVYHMASISGEKDFNHDNNAAGRLVFKINTHNDEDASEGSLTEKMRIGHNGNVGIGTTTPYETLNIVGSGTGTTVRIQTNGGQTAELNLLESSGTNGGLTQRWGGFIAYEGYDDKLNLGHYYGSGAGTRTKELTILSGGNVGIGTTIPSAKLDVAGDVKISGDVNIQGIINLKNDVVIGEDTSDLLVVHSETIFRSDITTFGSGTLVIDTSDDIGKINIKKSHLEKISDHVSGVDVAVADGTARPNKVVILNSSKGIQDINIITLGDGTSQGKLCFKDPTVNAKIFIETNNSTGSYTLTLPVDAGTDGYVLKTDGSGTLSWGEGGGGGITNNRIDGDLTIGEDRDDLLTIASNITVPIPTSDYHAATKIYVDNNINSSVDGVVILDSKTITSDIQDVDLNAGSNHTDYEYFSVTCIDTLGTEIGYITWKPINTSEILQNDPVNSKWESTNLTDGDEEAITHKNENYHILGYHTKGKQYIKVKIFSLNKADKKYSSFKSVGLHLDTGNKTISQEGNTSQVNTEICNKIRFNNYALNGSTLGKISSGTFVLYGYRKTGVLASKLIPSPTTSNIGKILQVNSTGDGYVFDITSSFTDEQIEDIIGTMVTTNNTETGITVTYQDGDGTIDFVVSDLTVTGDSGSTGITPGNTLNIAGGSNVTTEMIGDTLTISSSGGGISNNRINGDLTIGEDTNDILIVNSDCVFTGTLTSELPTADTHAATKKYVDDSAGAANGAVILDSKTIISNTQNVELTAGTNHANYEYYSVACIDVLGTLNGYIVWQPVDINGSLQNDPVNSKWKSTNLTDKTKEVITYLNKDFHIIGFHTLGKQHIKTKVFGLNKADKKYSTFKNVGLHLTGTETISQEGNTSQINTTICNKIRINNYAQDNTLGSLKGTFILYGYRKIGFLANTLIPSPTTSNIGKILQVNSAGDEYEFADYGLTVQEEGSSLSTIATTLNFIGTSVTASGTGAIKTINISGGGSGIVNNRIDGDLTIGEDTSDQLTIASKLNIPGGTTGHVLTKQADGSVEFAASSGGGGSSIITLIVTVSTSPSKFIIDGISQHTINLQRGLTYKFDVSDSTNSSHTFRFSTTSGGTHNSGVEYTTGVTSSGTPGNSGAYVQIEVANDAPNELYYYCTAHNWMGGYISSVNTGFTKWGQQWGHILPITNDTYDIGSADKKVRDLYLGSNSLWVGDTHKVSISDGKMKFRKRKTSSVPPAIIEAGGTEGGAKTSASASNLEDITLNDWLVYMRTLDGQSNAKISDIFRDKEVDYDDNIIAGSLTTNKIEGDLTIGEDNSDILTIASKLHIPGGESGQVLTKKDDGTVGYGPSGPSGMVLAMTTNDDNSLKNFIHLAEEWIHYTELNTVATAVGLNSKMLIDVDIGRIDNNSTGGSMVLKVMKIPSGGSATNLSSATPSNTNAGGHMVITWPNGSGCSFNAWQSTSSKLTVWDEPGLAIGATITYIIKVKSDGSATYINRNQQGDMTSNYASHATTTSRMIVTEYSA